MSAPNAFHSAHANAAPQPFTLTVADGRRSLRCWRWSGGRPGGQSVLVLHGLGDHGRALPYVRVAAALAGAGHAVVSVDQHGHGEVAPRERGRTRLATLVADVSALAQHLGHQHGAPPVLFGLSMGALVALRAAQVAPSLVRGVAAVAAPLGPVGASRFTQAAARWLAALAPELTLASGIDTRLISDDADACATYIADPLFHTRLSAGLGCDLLDAPAQIRAEAARLSMPLLLQHGLDDRIATWDPRLPALLPAARCTVRLYEQGRHNLFLDRGHGQVLADLLAWLATLPR